MDARENPSSRLRREVESALAGASDPGEVLPLLHRLARTAPPGGADSLYANLHLAELLVEKNPWRAALHARRVTATLPSEDRAWAVLGLCQTLLGNYRSAASAYLRALDAAPSNPWYAHNLGHLVDVALGRPEEAIAWLRAAYEGAEENPEIAVSFAHALARVGSIEEAKKVLAKAMDGGASREQAALLRWLEQGAPADRDGLPRAYLPARPMSVPGETRARTEEGARPKRRRAEESEPEAPPATRPRSRAKSVPELEAVLTRGLASLPLDTRQRARARALARDPVARALAEGAEAFESLAAAIAYAIVYVDHVPLTQAEVAATFRVSGVALRGRFGALRSRLHLAPGDERFATRRR